MRVSRERADSHFASTDIVRYVKLKAELFRSQILMGSNSSNAILSLLIVLQLGGALAFVLGGLYVLYCFNRAASGLERMADTAEAWLALQHYQVARNNERPAPNAATPNVAPPTIETPIVETIAPPQNP